jgi:hypothetical protein
MPSELVPSGVLGPYPSLVAQRLPICNRRHEIMFPDCRTVLRRTLVLSGLDGSSGIVRPRDNNYPPLLSATEKIFRLKRASALSV